MAKRKRQAINLPSGTIYVESSERQYTPTSPSPTAPRITSKDIREANRLGISPEQYVNIPPSQRNNPRVRAAIRGQQAYPTAREASAETRAGQATARTAS